MKGFLFFFQNTFFLWFPGMKTGEGVAQGKESVTGAVCNLRGMLVHTILWRPTGVYRDRKSVV